VNFSHWQIDEAESILGLVSNFVDKFKLNHEQVLFELCLLEWLTILSLCLFGL
jgi:hypothetical protein